MSIRVSRRELVTGTVFALAGLIAGSVIPMERARAECMFSENEGLDESAVNQRFIQMAQTYSEGDTLSPSDREFVDLYATPSGSRKTDTIYGSRYYNGATYEIMGNAYQNGVGDYELGATIQAGSGQSVSQKISIYCGYIGYYLDTVTHNYSKTYTGYNRNWFTAEFYDQYVGFTTSYRFFYSATITTADGNILSVS